MNTQENVLSNVIAGTCFLSTLSCLIVFGFYITFKQLQIEGFRNFILLIIGDLEWSFGNLISQIMIVYLDQSPQYVCPFLGLIQVQGALYSIFLSSFIMNQLVAQTKRKEINPNANYHHMFMQIMFLILSICLSVTPLIFSGYENGSGACYINSAWIAFVCFGVPMFICLTYNIVNIVIYIQYLNKIDDNGKRTQQKFKQLLLFPGIQIFCWFLPAAEQVIAVNIPFVLFALSCGLQGLLGFFEAVTYGFIVIAPIVNFRKVLSKQLQNPSGTDDRGDCDIECKLENQTTFEELLNDNVYLEVENLY